MSITPQELVADDEIFYPESDGLPMADNTRQFRWIVTIEGGLEAVYQDDPDVFVAGNLFWYPVQGKPNIVAAPDTMVVFGRPKGDRGSYKQWQEGGIAPQVVFEVLSPGNDAAEMRAKLAFYERYGVEEYYIYDPYGLTLEGWLRRDGRLQLIADMRSWVSPRLKIRFEPGDPVSGEELKIYRPDGEPFATYVEAVNQQRVERLRRQQAEQRAEHEQLLREQAEQELEQERQRVERLMARLKELDQGFQE